MFFPLITEKFVIHLRMGFGVSFSGRNLGYEVYKKEMGEEMFKKKIEEFEKVHLEFTFRQTCITRL